MKRNIIRIVLWVLLLLVALFAFQVIRHWDTIRRTMLGGYHTHETVPPQLPADLKRPAILVFSKTNGFRHDEAIAAAGAMFDQLAREKGWGIFRTENGAVMSPELLARFDAVVFSNASGDMFSTEQRAALKAYLEQGGGWVGIHAAGDNSHEGWDWYVTNVIGTRFIGHPLSPQFQQATVRFESHDNPATAKLGETWQHTDEWYSFNRPPRQAGITVLATLDEATYKPGSMFGKELAMGKDHPIVWTRCVGKGRALYSAIGHTPESYSDPEYKQLLAGAVSWAMKQEGTGCDDTAPATGKEGAQ